MPLMSGFELLEQLATMAPRYANIPFIFLTALAERNNEAKGLQLGALDYVKKPVDFDILTEIVTLHMVRSTDEAH